MKCQMVIWTLAKNTLTTLCLVTGQRNQRNRSQHSRRFRGKWTGASAKFSRQNKGTLTECNYMKKRGRPLLTRKLQEERFDRKEEVVC